MDKSEVRKDSIKNAFFAYKTKGKHGSDPAFGKWQTPLSEKLALFFISLLRSGLHNFYTVLF